MKYIFLALLLSSISLLTVSQTPTCFEATYEVQVKVISSQKHSGTYVLRANDTSSIYWNTSYPKGDKVAQQGNSYDITIGDPEGMALYTNYVEGTIQCKATYLKNDIFLIKRKIPGIEYHYTLKEKNANGTVLRLAQASFGKRKYDIWYNPAIPIQKGPWYFNGLAGLPYEVNSRDGEIKIELISIHPQATTCDIAKPTYGTPTSRKEFQKIFQEIKSSYARIPDAIIEVNLPNPESQMEKDFFIRLVELDDVDFY